MRQARASAPCQSRYERSRPARPPPRAITYRLPSDFFTAENKPMLKELCRHVSYADELAGDLEAIRVTISAVAAGSDARARHAIDQPAIERT